MHPHFSTPVLDGLGVGVKSVAARVSCGYDGNAPAWIAMDSVALTELAILVAFACFGLRELVKEVRTAQHRRPL